MQAPDLVITLVPAPDEPPIAAGCPDTTSQQQVELRNFRDRLKSKQVEFFAASFDPCPPQPGAWSGAHPDFYLGDFIIKLAAIIGPVLGTAIGVWLHGRYGRKVRLKIGDIEAEAQTREEVEKLLSKAQEVQQRNQPKVIHEP